MQLSYERILDTGAYSKFIIRTKQVIMNLLPTIFYLTKKIKL